MDPNPDPASHIHTSRQRPHPSSSSSSSPPFTLPAPPSAPPLVDGPSPSGHNRSTSLTSLKRTFSKILPANRSERGGTLRASQGRGNVEIVDATEDGRKEEEGGRREKGKIVKGEGRRSRSWSPRKGEVAGSSEVEGVAEVSGPQKEAEKESEKGGNAFQRLLGLRRASLPTSSTPAQPSNTRRLSLRRPKPKKAIHFASPPTQIPPPAPASRSGTSTPPLDSQQMYDQKRLRREQRRSYRSSEDYLTIAGANPRTGYWDVNTAIGSTSSSEVADRARAREAEIAENRRRLEAAKQELQEALAMREAEDRERDAKRARRRERDEARRREKRAREAGRWRAEGDGWRMVAEPGLSPIVGSLAGSPRMDRTPDDQLTEMRVPEEVVDKGYFGGEGREGRERGRSPEEERERRRLSRSPATPSRLSRQVGDTNGLPAQSTPMERKALPSASRVVSGDIPLYVASSSRKGGPSRKLSNDRVPELQSGQPSPVLERANPGRAAIFPSPRRQHHKPPFIDTGPETPPQGPRSPAISMRQSDNRKGSRGNALPNESVRRSPDRPNRDPFGPIPRRRPASPPKAVNTPPLGTQPAVETPRLEESTPVGERDVEPEVLRTEQQPHAVASSGVEAENRELEGSNDTIVRHSIAEALPGALPVDDRQRVPSDAQSFFRHSARRPTRRTSYSDLIPVSFDESSLDPPPVAPKPEGYRPGQAYQAHRVDERTPAVRAEAPSDGNIVADRPVEPKDSGRGDEQELQGDNRGRHEGSVHHHHHHYHTHYWVRSDSAPARSKGRKLRPEAFTQETANAIEQDPSTPGVTPERTKPPPERSLPTAGNRERYIIGGGSGSDTDEASYSKVVSETLARVRKRGREEHSHIHIYVPQPAVHEPKVSYGRSGGASTSAERGEGGAPERGTGAESRSRSAGAKGRSRSRSPWGRSRGRKRGDERSDVAADPHRPPIDGSISDTGSVVLRGAGL
ncbi:hypothetical protein V499_05448 [Pseudogymnoascus sp. VKM F-103]|nr:hypothetical protein V499_05448 [Pseudogymnoascus sp. VKM F-103]